MDNTPRKAAPPASALTPDSRTPDSMASDSLTAGLYVVATPIGNLGDVTHRAIKTLASARLVLCEDTRVTSKLLNTFAIAAKCRPYTDYTASEVRPRVLKTIKDGGAVALVSDAGTPLISDPGYRLVRAVREAGYGVFTVPGPSALTAALSIAGAPTDTFTFGGFLPSRTKARRDTLLAHKTAPGTLVFYETAKRLTASLEDCRAVLGERMVAIARELTKRHEEIQEGTFSEISAHYTAYPPKGEIVLVIHPAPARIWAQDEIDSALWQLLSEKSVKEAAGEVARQSGLPRQGLYRRALHLKKELAD